MAQRIEHRPVNQKLEQKSIEKINKTKKIKIKIEKIKETKSWFLEKVNKINKPLARLTNKKRDTTNYY